jgi:acetyl esterase/lipase
MPRLRRSMYVAVVLSIGSMVAPLPAWAQRTDSAAASISAETPPIIQGTRVEPALPEGVEQRLDVVYARHGARAMRLDLFRPKEISKPVPAIVVVHGGGWINGDKTRFRALAQALAARGFVTAAIEYRLAGEAGFPAAVQDCNAAIRWLRANARECGLDPDRIGAVGGSAGGHLVGLMAAAPDVREFQATLDGPASGASARVQAAVVMAGPFELATGPIAERSRRDPQQSNTNRWLGKTVDEAPELYRLASPMTHLSAGTPPVLFMSGEYDHPEQNIASRARLRQLGVTTDIRVYKSGRHGCWNLHPWFEPMVADMDVFFASMLRHDSAGKIVEAAGRPTVPAIPRVVTAAADGSVTLAAHDAVTHGEMLRYEPQPHKNTIGYWTRPEDWCEWHFYSEHPGRFELHILQGCGTGQGGSKVAASLGEQQVSFTVEDTGHFQNFKDRAVGTVNITAPGVYTLKLRALSKAAKAVMDVREVRLVWALME